MLHSVTLNQAKTFAHQVLKANLVPFLTSRPGAGKSSIARAIAKEAKLLLIDIRLANEDPTTLNGYPQIIDGRSTTAAPLRFPVEGDEVPEGYEGWLILLDELPSAPRSVIAGAYKIILDRMVGELKLHPKVRIIAAGNTLTDNAIVNEMGSAMRSRLVHITIKCSTKEWLNHAYESNFDSRATSYITYQPHKLSTFEQFKDSADETFACERGWEFASQILKANCPDESQPIPQEMAPLLAGTIGSIAYEFVAYTAAFSELPSMETILSNPDNADIPTAPAVRYLLVGMLASNVDKDNADTVVKYVNRLPKEFAMVFIKILWGKNPDSLTIPSVSELLNDVAHMLK